MSNDFARTSVRVSPVDNERGRIETGLADYPVLRQRAGLQFAPQRPSDQNRAPEQAFSCALRAASIAGRVPGALALDSGTELNFLLRTA